jgi:hypothetical protein
MSKLLESNMLRSSRMRCGNSSPEVNDSVVG